MNRLKDVLVQIILFRWVVTLVKVGRRTVKQFFATRLLLKLMSLVLGVLLWYAIAATEVAREARRIEVRPVFAGAVADGYELVEPWELEPKSVAVRGRSSVIDRLSRIGYVETERIAVHGRPVTDEWKAVKVDLGRLPGTEWDLPAGALSCDPAAVNVRVVIRSALVERVIRDVPVLVLAPTGSLREALLSPPLVEVHVLAPKSLLPALDAKSVRAYVDLTTWNNGAERKMVPEVVLPKGLRLARPPAAVTVKMEQP